MDWALIRKVSKLFAAMGVMTLLLNALFYLIIKDDPLVNVLTFIFIGSSTIVMAIGMKYPRRIIAIAHILITYALVVFSFLDDPGNLAGMFMALINFMLLVEYKFFVKSWQRIMIVVCYILPVIGSIIILGSFDYKLLPDYLLIVFFSSFLYTYIHHKKEEDFLTIEKSIKIIAELSPITDELFKISKRQIDIVSAQGEIIKRCKENVMAM